ncbi:MAG: POTRA domain-containing protein [Myxococcota bacterium]
MPAARAQVALARLLASLALALALAVVCPPGAARADDGDRIESLTMDAIDVDAPPKEDKDRLLEMSGLVPGNAFSAAEVRRAVKVLYQLGRFGDVRVYASREGNTVRLRLVLLPRPTVRDVVIEAQGGAPEQAILRGLGYKAQDELDKSSLPDRRRAIARALERAGYRQPAIGLALQDPDDEGGSVVLVRVDSGQPTRLHAIRLEGVLHRPEWRVRERLGLSEGDVLDLDRIDEATKTLALDYRADGYWDAAVKLEDVLEVEAGEAPTADLVLSVKTGPKISLQFTGNQVVPLAELRSAAETLKETGVGRAALAEVRERLLGIYERRGHFRARVEPLLKSTPDGTKAELIFRIQEGPVGRVVRLEFPGNKVFSEDDLRRTVFRVVESALAADLDRPASDPEVIAAAVGEGSIPPKTPRPQPHGPDPDPETVYFERAYRAAQDAIADQFRASGYPSVEVSPPKIEPLPGGQRLVVRMEVKSGVRWQIGSMALSGNDTISGSELLDIAELGPGQPLSFAKIEASRRAILAYYKNHGHLYARVDEQVRRMGSRTATASVLEVSSLCNAAAERGDETCDVELAYQIREGPEVHARGIVVRGVENTRRALVEGELTIAPGEVLRESDLLESQRNLLRLGVFRRVTVKPIDEEAEAAEKDVLVEVKEAKQSSFELGGGLSTEEGVRVFATYTHSNLLGSALRFQANARANVQPFLFLYGESVRPAIAAFYSERPLEFLVATGLSYPRILALPRGFSAGLDVTILRNNDPAFAEDTRTLTTTLDYTGFRPHLLGADRQITLQLRASFAWADLICNPALPAGGVALCGAASTDPSRRVEGTTIYTGLRPSVSVDFRDDPLNPRLGLYAEVLPEILFGLNGDSPTHLNLRAKLNGYLPVFSRASIAMSLVYWEIFPLKTDVAIPVNRRFFAGGRSTIRGYPEQTLYPRDADRTTDVIGLSPGGLLMVALKTELRFPLAGALDGTLFYDIGDLFEDPAKFVVDKNTRQGIGFGFRYATPIGPLLLDIAFPIVKKDDELSWVPHFAAVGSF